MDRSNFIEELFELLDENDIRYCVIGGQGVNAYVDPLISLDLDLVIASDQVEKAQAVLSRRYQMTEFAHSLNFATPGSKLRVQIHTDPRYGSFVDRAEVRDVLDLALPVAALEDILQGKGWAASDETRRPGKRQKDLLDISRILEARPALSAIVPTDLLRRIREF